MEIVVHVVVVLLWWLSSIWMVLLLWLMVEDAIDKHPVATEDVSYSLSSQAAWSLSLPLPWSRSLSSKDFVF